MDFAQMLSELESKHNHYMCNEDNWEPEDRYITNHLETAIFALRMINYYRDLQLSAEMNNQEGE